MPGLRSLFLFAFAAPLALAHPQPPFDSDWSHGDGGENDWRGHGHGYGHGHGPHPEECEYSHVWMISIDGMHSSDVEKWTAHAPNSNIAQMLQTGYEYRNAYTTAPSDSFPGTVAQITGATPKTAGVWYDVIYDRSYYAPGSGCAGAAGAEVADDETLDYNNTLLFSGGINPANLPLRKINGVCKEDYPHSRLRVNTIYEVVHSQGKNTAYTDKHPAYDLVRGPSGSGLTVGYFPEIASVANTVPATIAYDQLHVDAWLDWLDVKTPANSEGSLTAIPTLFGGNFQSLSVAQKTVGYNNDSSDSLSTAEIEALTFIDNSIGAVINKLKAKDLYDSTLIVVASKHGQAPIKRSLYQKVDPAIITSLAGVPVEYQASDDVALIFLNNSADAAKAAANLNAGKAEGKILSVIWGANLTKSGFGDPLTDPAVPDIIVQPELGVIYTTSSKKVAEHGGLSADDRLVACFLSSPKLRKTAFKDKVFTTQVAPTVLKSLGIHPKLLSGASAEGTKVLPGFEW